MTRAELAQQLWTDAQSNVHLQRQLRASYRGRHDVLDALWWRAHPSSRSPGGEPDPATALPDLMADVYSRRSTTEPLIEFVDPISHQVVLATPSGRALRLLTLDLARDTAALDATVEELCESREFRQFRQFRQFGDTIASDRRIVTPSSPLPTRHRGFLGARRQRWRSAVYFVVAGVVAGAVATAAFLGVTGGLTGSLTAVFAPATSRPVATTGSSNSGPQPDADEPFRIFAGPAEVATGIAPLLGAEFMPLRVRSIPNRAALVAGFEMFAAQRADGQFCLILKHPRDEIDVVCASPEIIMRRGLRLAAIVVPDLPGSTYPQPFIPVNVTIVWDRNGVFTSHFEPRFS